MPISSSPRCRSPTACWDDSAIDGSDSGTTDGQQARLAALGEDWARQQRTAETLFGDELAAFNRLVRDRNVPAVVPK